MSETLFAYLVFTEGGFITGNNHSINLNALPGNVVIPIGGIYSADLSNSTRGPSARVKLEEIARTSLSSREFNADFTPNAILTDDHFPNAVYQYCQIPEDYRKEIVEVQFE